jgi:hypothetical protein
VHSGNGRHADTLTEAEFERAAMLNTIGFAPGILAFVVPKLGVTALLIRIFSPSRPWKIFLWALVGGGGLAICGCIVIIYAQCHPTRALWTPNLSNAQCWDPWILVDYSIFAGCVFYLSVKNATSLTDKRFPRVWTYSLRSTLGLSC